MLQKGNKPLNEYYSMLRCIWEELNMCQPITSDVDQLNKQWEEFQVAKFLSCSNLTFPAINVQILANDSLLSLNSVYFRVQQATITLSISRGYTNENLALVSMIG